MLQAGVTIKKVRVVNIPQRRSQRLGEFDERILDLQLKLENALSNNEHLIFVDECVFKARGFQMKAWAAPG